jgi:hypothetical protein
MWNPSMIRFVAVSGRAGRLSSSLRGIPRKISQSIRPRPAGARWRPFGFGPSYVHTLIAAIAVVLLNLGQSAQAKTVTTTTLTLDDSEFEYTYVSAPENTGKGPTSVTDNLSHSFTNIKLNTPITDKNFITVDPASSSGITCGKRGEPLCSGGYDVSEGTLTVTLDFTLLQTVTTKTTGQPKQVVTTDLGTGELTVTGTYVANYDGRYAGDPCTDTGTLTDCIIWSGEPPGATSSTFQVQLNQDDAIYVTLFNAQDWDMTPKISLDLDPPTPLPATLPLLIGGLGVFGFLGRRRQKKIAARG